MLLGVLMVMVALSLSHPAWATDKKAKDEAVAATIKVPKILDAADSMLYRDIFKLQTRGQWRRADRRIKKLQNRLLVGHVLAQRFLHPTHYRSRFRELERWMRHYADHPDARRIYRLALRRKPTRARAPRVPQRAIKRLRKKQKSATPRKLRKRAPFYMGRTERRLQRRIGRYVFREHLSRAERYLKRRSTHRAVGTKGIDRARAIIASGWFRRGNTKRALALAARAADRSGMAAPRAQWWAGLSAFRLGRLDTAARYFQTMHQTPGLSDTARAASAFWAARSHLLGRQPQNVTPWLARAAAYPRTFYGFMAAYMMGTEPQFNWQAPRLDPGELETLSSLHPGKRAMALIQVGEGRRAELELRKIRYSSTAGLLRTVIALAGVANLPGTQLRAARTLRTLSGKQYDGALYPISHWTPHGGYLIDRALINALARQESGFNTRAKSRRGARGLLQLMPATARIMAQRRGAFRGRGRDKLFDPDLNLSLGQKYVDHLLNGDVTSGNMVLMIASYNGGPGNTSKWQRKLAHGADPLIFMETIPLRETRNFVKRVFENLWVYRARLGQDAPSLAALAAGQWPSYVGLDETPRL